jgi:hypothetical protein
MKTTYFHLPGRDRDALRESIRDALAGRSDLSFAYLHGSFLTRDRFRDIDIALHLKKVPSSTVQAELDIETELIEAVGGVYPVDVRILNTAPVSFRYSVIKNGEPVWVADEEARTVFVETTLSRYFDFAPFHKRYLRETLGIGIQRGQGQEDHL